MYTFKYLEVIRMFSGLLWPVPQLQEIKGLELILSVEYEFGSSSCKLAIHGPKRIQYQVGIIRLNNKPHFREKTEMLGVA